MPTWPLIYPGKELFYQLQEIVNCPHQTRHKLSEQTEEQKNQKFPTLVLNTDMY